MKYSVQLRMNGASGTQFLIDSWGGFADLLSAFYKGQEIAKKLADGHYVEIVQEDCYEVVATFR